LRFRTSSNFVTCSTGKSGGFSPLKILSTKYAARRYIWKALAREIEMGDAGLATATAKRVVAGKRELEVARVRITEAGRKALAERQPFERAKHGP
jgi:hypothetical protein